MASRGLRAMGAGGGIGCGGFCLPIASYAGVGCQPDEEALARAGEIVRQSSGSHGHLALLGDKSLLFAAEGDAFLMYAVSGRRSSWVSLWAMRRAFRHYYGNFARCAINMMAGQCCIRFRLDAAAGAGFGVDAVQTWRRGINYAQRVCVIKQSVALTSIA